MVSPVSAFLLAASTLNLCNGANILGIFPTASFSHQQPLLAVSRALAARGHNLTVINTNPNKTPLKNYRDIDLGFMYKEWDALKKAHGLSLQERISPFKIVSDFKNFVDFFCQKVLDSHQIQDLIKEVNGTTFDLILYESLSYSSLLGLSELVGNPPIVGFMTLHPFTINDLYVGNPEIPSYIPSVVLPYEHRMTFFQRMTNFALNVYFHYQRIRYIEPLQEVFLKRYFGDVKHTAYELERNISLMLISGDLATSYPKPVHPNTIYIGPAHIEKPPPLPQDIQKWMDESEDGVVYFSLGSNMKGTSVPAEKRAAFIKAFSQFPTFRVLWKWESDEKLPGQPDNVLVKKWLPQQSILAHPKTRLFISQVGLQSFQEATTYGVPILGIPMFGDQDWNGGKLVQAGAGRVMEFYDIAYDIVYDNLKELLTNKSYKANMMTLSKITNDKPMPAVETAVWWIEYVIRHQGAPHLRPACFDLTWYQYYSLDVIAFILAVILAAITVAIYALKIVVRNFTGAKLKTH
nr:UDP-glucuronosyltransferase [Nilaparvata lugens]